MCSLGKFTACPYFHSSIPCDISIIHLTYPYDMITTYIDTSVTFKELLFYRLSRKRKIKDFNLSSFIPSRTLFLSLLGSGL